MNTERQTHNPVGRVSPQGVTRQMADAEADADVGLRYANPTYQAGSFQIEELINAGLLEIGDGYRAKNSELSGAGIPFARAANINDGFKFDAADFFPLEALPKGNKSVVRVTLSSLPKVQSVVSR